MIEAIGFTLLQAGLSALGSLFLGAFLAYTLIRLRSRLWMPLIYLPFFCPPLSVVLGILRVFGDTGIGMDVFGLGGIILCHLILNIPVATKLFYEAYSEIPEPQIRLAMQFDQIWRLIDWDVLYCTARRVFAIVFLFCTISFTIVLTLGGGPKTTTLELAIYQEINYSYNLEMALKYTLVQALIGVMILAFIPKGRKETYMAKRHQITLPWGRGKVIILALALLIIFLLTLPLIVLIFSGISGLGEMNGLHLALIAGSFIHSIKLALLTTLLTHLMAFILIKFRAEAFAWVIGTLSPLALATLLILILRPWLNPFDYGFWLISVLQALAYLPFIMTMWQLALEKISTDERKLAFLYFPKLFDRLSKFWLPNLWLSVVEISATIIAISIGDLALSPLLAPQSLQTMPMLVWEYIGSYQFDAANALIVIIMGIILLLFLIPFSLRKWNA